jgi:YhcH/YjgK/YiaL family protein
MIYSSIYGADDISKYPQVIQEAIEYLKSNDFTTMEPGTYVMKGKDMYALVMDIVTSPVEDKKPETHKQYIDVQFVAAGVEKLGFTTDTGNYSIIDAKEENDIYFYGTIENESFIISEKGCYSIFFPSDIHRPACMVLEPAKVRKVVVKIKKDLI